ncbi:hypothetical protein [Lapidilactobacillus luobeiensis]|uniref:hypothetical protein n=1 Tax=Lapidilactobacillus luobeiensis TaxID=2950371 RepID=UPI0021C45B05|nr:hypothetical protein [Lapidilactobacillus luobeiensis]
MNLKKFFLFTILFWAVFIIIGDAYIYYLDGQALSSDYTYQIGASAKHDRAYQQELSRRSQQLDLKVYVVDHQVTGQRSAKYTIYTFKENQRFMQKRLQTPHDVNKFNSLLNGRREVVFKPFSQRQVKSNYRHLTYYAFGSKASIDQLRDQTIDKYGMSRPTPNNYRSDAVWLITAAWLFAGIVVLFSTLFEVNSWRKEVLIRYLNGADRRMVIGPLMKMNTLILVSSAVLGLLLAATITTATKFIGVTIAVVLGLVLISNLLFLRLRRLDLKQTFARSYYPRGYRILTFVTLSLTIITLLGALTLNLKSIHDAVATVRQEKSWQRFADYDNVYFLFKDLTKTTNQQTDEQHALDFYNANLDRYQMYLSFDFENNGGTISNRNDYQDDFLYLNKYAQADLRQIGLAPTRFSANKFYLISPYSRQELKTRKILAGADQTQETAIDFFMQGAQLNSQNCEVIQMKHSYRFLVKDINLINLADNYHRDPVIILDTHSKFPTKSLSYHVFDSLVKFQQAGDFDRFLNQIGYQDQIHYQRSVKAIYLEKRADKLLLLILNLILSLLLLALFNFSLTLILHLEFKARAVEISLGKIMGRSLFQRYRGLLTLIAGAIAASALMLLIVRQFLYHFSLWYGLLAIVIVILNLTLIVTFFIRHYEKVSIPRVLKGGN